VGPSRSGRCGEEKNSHHCPHRELNPGRPARSVITIVTEVSRLPMTRNLHKFLFNSTGSWFVCLLPMNPLEEQSVTVMIFGLVT
jgi:hypothetical protein